MTDPKKDDVKTQIERLASEFDAEDMGTYMDARVEGKVLRVAVWNAGLNSYQPTDDGLALLAQPPKEKEKEKEKGKAKVTTPQPGQPATMGPPPQPGTPPAPPAGPRPPTV